LVPLEEQYEYDEKKRLLSILVTTNNQSYFNYIRPSGRRIKQLSDSLAEKLAVHIITQVVQKKYDSPVFFLHLYYHAMDQYWPLAGVVTSNTIKEAISRKYEIVFLAPSENVPLAEPKNVSEEFNKDWGEFFQVVHSKENWKAARELLIKTARRITQSRLDGKVPVSEHFFAFPADWEMDMGQEAKLMIASGADKQKVKEWKKARWI
jgi:hypothetical protein